MPKQLGDIPRDLRSADDFPRSIAYRRHCQGDRENSPIFCAPSRLIMFYAFATGEAIEDLRDLVDNVGSCELGDVLAHNLISRVTKKPLSAPVPALNYAV